MRRLGRGLLWIGALLLAITAGRPLLDAIDSVWSGTLQSQREGWRVSLGLQLAANEWINYPLPARASEVRLLSNLLAKDAEAEHSYNIEYRLVDSAGQTLKEGTSGFLVQSAGNAGGRRQVSGAEHVAASREMVLPLARGSGRVLRLRWGGVEGAASGLFLRVYVRERLDASELRARWRRYTQAERRSLADHHELPLEWLSPGEREGLTRQAWRPLASGEDRALQNIYIADERQDEEQDSPTNADFLRYDWVDANHDRWYRWDQSGLSLQAQTADGGAAQLRLHFQGATQGESWLVAPSAQRTLPAGPGWLRVESDQPVRLRVLDSTQQPAEVGMAERIRYFPAQPKLEYRLPETPAGRDLRVSWLLFDDTARLQLNVLDKNGATLLSETLGDGARPLRLKQDPREPAGQLFGGSARYIKVPAEARSLRVTGTSAGLLRLQSRPASMPRVRPLGSVEPSVQQSSASSWFDMLPETAMQLDWRWIEQQRIPRDARLAEEGGWRWRRSLSPSRASNRRLALMTDASGQSGSACVSRFENGLLARPDAATEAPLLLFFAADLRAGMAEISADNRPWARTAISSRSGSWRLPSLPANGARLQLRDGPLSGTELWIGPLAGRPCTARAREVWTLTRRGLRFALPPLSQQQRVLLQILPPSAEQGSASLHFRSTALELISRRYRAQHWEMPFEAGPATVKIAGTQRQAQSPALFVLARGDDATPVEVIDLSLRSARSAWVRVWVEQRQPAADAEAGRR